MVQSFKSFAAAAALCSSIVVLSQSRAHADDLSDVGISDGVLVIEASPFDDMIGIQIDLEDDQKVIVHILHFLTLPPNLEFPSIEAAISAADDFRIERRSLNRFTSIRVEGYEGNDIVFVEATLNVPALLIGGDGNDSLFGGAADDLLYGDDRDETAGTGNDLLVGNRGEDMIFGGSGDDDIRGGLDNDYLSGGKGHDWMRGDGGNDTIGGEDGNDVINGGSGDDDVFGDEGDDDLDGGVGEDRVFGGSGNDILTGGFDGSTDFLRGNQGTDLFLEKFVRLVTEYKWVINRRTGRREFRKVKTPVILEKDTIDDLSVQSGDKREATIIEE